MGLIPAPKKPQEPKSDESGIALFMVIAAMTVLSVLVTEFTYVAQVNSRMAFDSLDQIKAHYLAKSGLKLSLLRLKAYSQVSALLTAGGAGAPAIPKSVLEKIWSFPFFYPFPTNLPGMTSGDKDAINAFQKESGLEGNYSAAIESESSKYNLNSILISYAAPVPSATPKPSGSPTPGPSVLPFDPAGAEAGLTSHFQEIWDHKLVTDPDYAQEHRDFHIEDLMDNIFAWADVTYQQKSSAGRQIIPIKKAPFYSVTELHMIYPMDDGLYELFTPGLTAATTPGINVNTMKELVLRAIVPFITDDEVTAFYKFRDSEDEDNNFKAADDFFKYLQGAVAGFHNSADEITKFRTNLSSHGVQFVTIESAFKITVQAQVNQASRLIEAWVTLGGQTPGKPNPSPSGVPPGGGGAISTTAAPPPPDPGLKITFMRLL